MKLITESNSNCFNTILGEWVSQSACMCHEHLVFRSYLNSYILNECWCNITHIEHRDKTLAHMFLFTYVTEYTHSPLFVMSFRTCTYFPLFFLVFPSTIRIRLSISHSNILFTFHRQIQYILWSRLFKYETWFEWTIKSACSYSTKCIQWIRAHGNFDMKLFNKIPTPSYRICEM